MKVKARQKAERKKLPLSIDTNKMADIVLNRKTMTKKPKDE
jgi:hypothetical protein